MMRMQDIFSSAVVIALALGSCAASIPDGMPYEHAIAIKAKPTPLGSGKPQPESAGSLIYRGGLVLSSGDAGFGGWSGLVISADGKHLLSQSDEAHWLRADLAYDAAGNLSGIDNARIAPMLNLAGRPMARKEGDAEGLDSLTPGDTHGPVLVSFERNDSAGALNRVWSYDLTKSLGARPQPVAMPKEIGALESNLGLESLTMFRRHAILVVAEVPQFGDAHPAWLVPYDGRDTGVSYGPLSVKMHRPYEISDAAMSPDGKKLYLLERHYYGPLRGIVAAVREVDAASVKAGAQLDGKEIATFTMQQNIDNMEGMALRHGPHGETLLYLISDDNYSPIQRTLLLMFEIAPGR